MRSISCAGILTSGGRTTALSRLTSLVRAADPTRSGEGGSVAVALVAGEGGVGKTRLLRELVAETPADSVVLGGQAEPGSLGRPLDVVYSLLGDTPLGPGDPRPVALDALIGRVRDRSRLIVTTGQLDFELAHLRSKIAARAPSELSRLPDRSLPRAHPLFDLSEGPAADWERGVLAAI